MGQGMRAREIVPGWIQAIANPDLLEAPDRTFPGHRDILTRSLARYHFVAQHMRGKTIDIGCGRGYGFPVLQYSSGQVGLDMSSDFLRAAQAAYPDRPLVQATGSLLPFISGSFDALVAFEVIEHIDDDIAFLWELRRLGRTKATIAISTPNKRIVSSGSERPLNRWHVREYLPQEFASLVRKVFPDAQIFGQHDGSSKRGADALPPSNIWSNIVNSVPLTWRNHVPAPLQGLLTAVLAPPLRLEDVRFDPIDLEHAHTFVAICSAE